jgi:hypothetical protein
MFTLGAQKFVFGCIYRPPGTDLNYLNKITNCINYIATTFINHKLLFVGDFNFPNLNWSLNHVTSQNDTDIAFLECLMELNLTQLVNFPTRKENYLDLAFCRNISDIKANLFLQLIPSDHECISLSISSLEYHTVQSKVNKVKIFDFQNTDFNQIINYLNNINWWLEFSKCNDINDE